MPGRKKTKFALLGLLSWQPMSGYDIKKLIEVALSHFWHESYGQLYPTLAELVEEGLAVRKTARRHGRRQRNVFTLTVKGRRQFLEWLREPSDLPRVRNEFQLKFFLSCRRPVEESIDLLQQYRGQQQERRELYADSEQILTQALHGATLPDELREVIDEESRQQALFFLLTLRHGVRTVEARLAWCDEALRALRGERRRAPRVGRGG